MEAAAPDLTDEFLSRLRAFVRRRVRTEHDADDVVQDVLAKLLRHDAAVRAGSVHAWLFTTARRAIIDRARAERRDAALPDGDLSGDHLAGDPSASADLARCLEPMMASLDSDDRALLERVDKKGESQAALARELGISASGLKSRVQRARRRLRAVLEDCCAVDRDGRGAPADYRRRPGRPCPCDAADGPSATC